MFWELCDESSLCQGRAWPHHWLSPGRRRSRRRRRRRRRREAHTSPGRRGTYVRKFLSQILKRLSLKSSNPFETLTFVVIPAGYCRSNSVLCFLHNLFDTLTIVISRGEILEIVTRHLAIVPKENLSNENHLISLHLVDLMPNRIGSSLLDFFTCHLKMSNFRLKVEKKEVCLNFSFIFCWLGSRWPS